MNNLCYLIKLLSVFPACVIYSPFVTLSIFAVLSNLFRIIKLLPSSHPLLSTHFYFVTRRIFNGISAIVRFRHFFLWIYISLVISQDIPSCETFSRGALFRQLNNNIDNKPMQDNLYKVMNLIFGKLLPYFHCFK